MSYLIDTCVFSEYKKLKPETKVIEWLKSRSDESLYVSALTIGEIDKGIQKMPESRKKADLSEFLESLIDRFDGRIVPVDTAIARRWGQLVGELETTGQIIPIIDCLIAATAIERNLTVVTRNVADFKKTGVAVLDLWV